MYKVKYHFLSLATCFLVFFTHNNLAIRYNEPQGLEFDYIIVGGGTAGSVVASRLSENPDHTVLVLEAGINDRDYPDIDIPCKSMSLQRTYVDWQYRSQPMKNACKDLVNQQAFMPTGKVLGGSSSHNTLDYIRGSPYDFDWWESLGNTGWGYKDVLPYFKKAENNIDLAGLHSEYHGTGGPLNVETIVLNDFGEKVVNAGEELGYKRQDPNEEDSVGIYLAQTASKHGLRMNTALAYLWPHRGRENLFVATKAHVIKILFTNRTAVGVEYIQNDNLHVVHARKEIILSAGAMGSPHLLMLSGVGPADHLKSHGIDIVSELPVGSELEDHYMTMLTFTINETLSMRVETMIHPLAHFKHVFGLKGFYSTAGHIANGFFITKSQPNEHKFPYIQGVYMMFLPGNSKGLSDVLRDNLNIMPKYWDDLYEYERGKDGFVALLAQLHPRKTGTVRLNNTDPFTQPVIRIEYLDHPDEVKDMIEAIRIHLKMIQTKSLQKLGAKYETPHHKACLQHAFDTDEYWECYIRQRSLTVYHQTSTCKMSPGKDGVVDNKLRVKGVNNLRVIDASIMPHVTSGNTMTPTIMIAEKGADMIKEDAK